MKLNIVTLLAMTILSTAVSMRAAAKSKEKELTPGPYIIQNRLVQIGYGYYRALGDSQITWVSDTGERFSNAQLLESPRWTSNGHDVFLIRTRPSQRPGPVRISVQLVSGIEEAGLPGDAKANLFLVDDLPAEQGPVSNQLDARFGDHFVTLNDLSEYLTVRLRDSAGARIEAQGAVLSLWKRDPSKAVELARLLAAIPGGISREGYLAVVSALDANPNAGPLGRRLREALETSQIPRPDTTEVWIRQVRSRYQCLQLLAPE